MTAPSREELFLTEYAKALADEQIQVIESAQRRLSISGENRAFIEIRIEEAKAVMARFSTYRPSIDSRYRCPVCWVLRNRDSALRSIDNTGRHAATYACNICQTRYDLHILD